MARKPLAAPFGLAVAIAAGLIAATFAPRWAAFIDGYQHGMDNDVLFNPPVPADLDDAEWKAAWRGYDAGRALFRECVDAEIDRTCTRDE